MASAKRPRAISPSCKEAATQMRLCLFSPFASAMPLDPIKNQGVGLFRRLPEETVRLPFQNLELRARDALRQYFGLRHVVAPDRVSFADNH